jgi:hypothetical protein
VPIQPQLPLVGGSERTPGAQQVRPDDDWRIDERTRRAGRRGLAVARAALARSTSAEASRATAA